MKVLVTGGTGMLGRVLKGRLSGRYAVTATSKSGKEGVVACDLSNEDDVRKLFEAGPFDFVIHTAAYSDVDGCERDPGLAHASNALATKYLAQNCALRNIPFIYVSTDYVFDGLKKTPYSENDPVCPVNVYGMTKLEGEYYAKTLPRISAVVRTSWLFGPKNPANFVNAIWERLKKEKIVRVLADQEDSPTYVGDLSEALEKIGAHLSEISKKDARWNEVFQVCNAGSTTRFDLTVKIKELLGLKDVNIEKLDKKDIAGRLAIRPPYAVMSRDRFENFFKTKMRRWEESLGEYLKENSCAS